MRMFYKILFLVAFMVLSNCKSENNTQKEDNPKIVSIYTIGDSTMANKPNPEENPERGWAQMLPQFLNVQATVKNHAVNGRSSRSFISEQRWDSVYKMLREDDYVFIQFGHNDQKVNSPKRYTNPHTAYRNNLIKFVVESREKKAIPVLFTSITRRNFNEDSTLVDTHGVYPLEVRLVAQEYQVPLIDLQYLTEKLEESLGHEGSKKLHLHFRPNEISYYPDGKEDNTHLSVFGATEIARMAVEALEKEVEGFKLFVKK